MTFSRCRGTYCSANNVYALCIDEQGRLHKCWEDVDKPGRSFGTASRWDPRDPIVTADSPDKLICYLETTLPFEDEKCLKCVWLPTCIGGCPNRLLYCGDRNCLPYRDDPERYVMTLYERLKDQKKERI